MFFFKKQIFIRWN